MNDMNDMNEDIITITIANDEFWPFNIAIDREQTSVSFFAHGIIAGALKAYYTHRACKRIGEMLAVNAGLSKAAEVEQSDIAFITVANRIYIGIRELFYNFVEREAEVKRCCKLIINELSVPACPVDHDDE